MLPVIVTIAAGSIVAMATMPNGSTMINGAKIKEGDMRALLTFFLTVFVAVMAILNVYIKGGDGNPGEWLLGPWLMILTFYFSDRSHQQTAQRTADAAMVTDMRAAVVESKHTSEPQEVTVINDENDPVKVIDQRKTQEVTVTNTSEPQEVMVKNTEVDPVPVEDSSVNKKER